MDLEEMIDNVFDNTKATVRTSEAIDTELAKLGDIWKRHPMLRFGQLVSIASNNQDLFEMEVADIQKGMSQFEVPCIQKSDMFKVIEDYFLTHRGTKDDLWIRARSTGRIEFEMKHFLSGETYKLGAIENYFGLPGGDYIVDRNEATVLFGEVSYSLLADKFICGGFICKDDMIRAIEIMDALEGHIDFFRQVTKIVNEGRSI